MKLKLKVIVAALLIILCMPLTVRAERQKIQFGEYPQSMVTNSQLLEKLSGITLDGLSSVTYEGERYRKKDNGNWYKYEPISWLVLSEANGKAFVISEKIIDVCALNEKWTDSEARKWLNTTFINSAFDVSEKECIYTTTVNSVGEQVTQDKLFYPSQEELTNAQYGFCSNEDRVALDTAYSNAYQTYLTRDTWATFIERYVVAVYGWNGNIVSMGAYAGYGARPCMNIELSDVLKIEQEKKIEREKAKIKDLSKATITLSKTSYKYDGKSKVPTVTVKYDGKKLVNDTDYSVKYENNKYVGTALVTVTGKGKFTGDLKKSFSITSPGKVTIKLNSNGGKVAKKSVSVSIGARYGKLPVPTMRGYVFTGWYTAKTGGKLINTSSHVSKAMTLYAHWNKAKYKITYVMNGGTNSKKNPKSYTVTTKTFSLASPSKKGYVFKGWYTDNKYKKSIKTITRGSCGNKTLYAKWGAVEYTIKFNPGGATSGKMSNISAKYDKYYTLPANKYKKTGFQFLYWQGSVNGKTQRFDNLAKVSNLTTKNKAVVTLTACWKAVPLSNSSEGKTVTIVNPDGSKAGFSYNACYSDKYFSRTNSVDVAKSGLAKLSAVAALSTYGDSGSKAKLLLSDCGFKSISAPVIGTSTRTQNHNASLYLGKRTLTDGTTIVAIWINGYTAGGYEWISNFELGTGEYHTGFYKASEKVFSAIKKYIQGSNSGKLKVWITGHSRGAALTNLVAMRLIDGGLVNGNNVYAYGFATPQYTMRAGSGYKTIINYISPHDFVPYVAPTDWNYRRFGTDITFDDSNSGVAISKYNSYSGTNLYFGRVEYRKELIKAFVELGGSPTEYTVSKKYGNMSFSAKDFAQNGIALTMTNDAGEGIKNLLNYSAHSEAAYNLTMLLGGSEKLVQYVTDTHAMLMYLAWIDTLYPVSGQSYPLF